MSDDTDKKPWMIKSMPIVESQMALAAATKRGLTLAAWLVTAIRDRADKEGGDRVILPDERLPAEVNRANVAQAPTLSIDEIKSGLEAARLAADALGKPIPKGTATAAIALINAHYRAARGMPEIKRRPLERKVLMIEG